jgi:uncharacterized protein YecE (DUF72 family)
MALPEIRVGTSGWNYGHWRGVFYPEDLPSAKRLAFYQSQLDTVELNASFYREVRPATFAKWQKASPQGFLWAVKAHRVITHITRLESAAPLKRFLDSLDGLGHSLGVVLFQLPPSLKFHDKIAERFFDWLPHGRRYALEPRHSSWFFPPALRLLERHQVALCIADSGGRFPMGEHLTAPFTYLRFHGGVELYASRYSRRQIREWAEKIVRWSVPAFVYFNNDFEGHAVENARELKEELSAIAACLCRQAAAVPKQARRRSAGAS